MGGKSDYHKNNLYLAMNIFLKYLYKLAVYESEHIKLLPLEEYRVPLKYFEFYIY